MPDVDDTQPIIEKLEPKQVKAIAALLEESTISKAAVAAGISHATIHRWLQEPEFRRAFMHARWRTVQQSIARVQSFSSEAILVLYDIMSDKSAPYYARLSAANSIINTGLRGVELEDHDERLSQIQDDIAFLRSQESKQ